MSAARSQPASGSGVAQPDREISHGAPEANAVRPPSGLPILSTEPLTEAERKLLSASALAHQELALLIDLSIGSGRVADGLAVMAKAAEVAELDARIALKLGSLR